MGKFKQKLFFCGSILSLLLATSCGVNSNLMFQTKNDKNFKYDSIPMRPIEQYKLSADDKITFTLTTKDGAPIIERMSGIRDDRTAAGNNTQIDYLINQNGEANLPILGMVKIGGLTVTETETLLSSLYSKEYQQPFVQVKVTNQRVIVFPGNGSDAKVIPLQNTNTTLMEALAQAGGITERGKANTVKLMRKVEGKREVYLIDLSTIDGLIYADMIVQANDYIYVEPNPQVTKEVIKDVAPVISIISSMIIIVTFLITK